MSGRRRIAIVFGTRPEAIKLAPLVLELRRRPEVECRVILTAQHRELVDPVLGVFGLTVDRDLDLMRPDQSPADLVARSIRALDACFAEEAPDVVVVQGDTSTVFSAALAAYYRRLEVAHVEAGLRTRDKLAPFPEEVHRCLVAPIADYHFVPTERARRMLLEEAVPGPRIHLTGNTVIDALLLVREKNRAEPPELPPGLEEALTGRRVVLVTGHRRESFGGGLERICRALVRLAAEHTDVAVVYPVHLNPNVHAPVHRLLEGRERIHLLGPQPYRAFVWLLERARLVVTDSGGIQEEAPSLGRPLLVTREVTERPEVVEAGGARLVGTDPERIFAEASRLLRDEEAWRAMASVRNPYGDAKASKRIADVLCGRQPEPFMP